MLLTAGNLITHVLRLRIMASPSENGTVSLSSASRGISDIFAVQLEVTGRLLEAEQNKVSF